MEHKIFFPQKRKKVLVSKDFRDTLITQQTTLIEQRIIVTILSAIKQHQSNFINPKLPFDEKNGVQLSFDDYFDGWANQGVVDFEVSFRDINFNGTMKNSIIQEALINMTNINWLRLQDASINGYKAVPFILEPSWNRTTIFFKMDRAVMKHLLNMQSYIQIKKELPYLVSTSNTIRFLMWLYKYKYLKNIVKSYSQILKELNISEKKYEGHYRFTRDFLVRVKADLDAFSDYSFNFSLQNQHYHIVIYPTKNTVDHEGIYKTIDELQIERSLNFIKKQRQLEESQLNIIRKFYLIKGYKVFSKKIKRKIPTDIKGTEYIKAILLLLENEKG